MRAGENMIKEEVAKFHEYIDRLNGCKTMADGIYCKKMIFILVYCV